MKACARDKDFGKHRFTVHPQLFAGPAKTVNSVTPRVIDVCDNCELRVASRRAPKYDIPFFAEGRR